MNFFDVEEISIFLRYRTFPLFLNLAVLFSFVHILWAYFKSKKKEILFLGLVAFSFFVKELMLFLATRHVLFDFELGRIAYQFSDWMILECLSTFLAISFFGSVFYFFSFGEQFSYPLPNHRKDNLITTFVLNGLFILPLCLLVFLLKIKGYDFSILLPLWAMYYLFVFLRIKKRFMLNYGSFNFYFLAPKSLNLLHIFVALLFLLMIFFAGVGFLFFPFRSYFGGSFNLDPEQFFDSVETYLHGFKTVVYVVFAVYIMDFLRRENLSTVLEEEEKKKKVAEFAGFFKRLRILFIEGAPVKEIASLVMNKIKKEINAEMVVLLFDHRSRRVNEFSIGQVTFAGEQINAFMLPYLSKIESIEKDFLVNDLESLSLHIKNSFYYLPQKTEVEAVKKKREKLAKQKDVAIVDQENTPNKDKKEEHYVSHLLAKICKNDWEKTKLSLIVINKSKEVDAAVKDDSFIAQRSEKEVQMAWDRYNAFVLLEVIGEEIVRHSDYFMGYEKYKEGQQKEMSQKLYFEVNRLMREMNDYHLARQIEEKIPLDFSAQNVFSNRGVKSFFRFANRSADEVMLLCFDVVGNYNWTMFFHSIMQLTFDRFVKTKKSLEGIMGEFNKVIHQYKQDNFVNALLFSFNFKKNKKLTFVSASHQPPMFFLRKSSDILMHDIKNYPLGVKKGEKYKEKSFPFTNGDIVVVYSENLLSLTSKDGEEKYDLSRFAEIVKKNCDESAQKISKLLVQDVVSFCKGSHDDLSKVPIESVFSEEHLIITVKL